MPRRLPLLNRRPLAPEEERKSRMQAAINRGPRFDVRERRAAPKADSCEPVRYQRLESSGLERPISAPARFAIIFFLGVASWALVAAAVLLVSWLA
jgi:hypothetical protein